MYNVYTMSRHGHSWRVIVVKSAGGCTRYELNRENERKAQSKAAREFGGYPENWAIERKHGLYDNLEAANTIADYQRGYKKYTLVDTPPAYTDYFK